MQKNKQELKELLPLTSDIVFKRVFAREGNEDILKSLLEAILNIKIQKVEVKNPELTQNIYDSKAGILDIKVQIDENIICDVELQVQNEMNIDSRSTIYMSNMVSTQLKKGEEYTKLKKTIVINILMFNYYKRNSYHSIAHMKFEKTKPNEYVDLGYKQEDEIATEDLEMHFIELPKFKKKNPETGGKLEKWLWLITGEGEKLKMDEKIDKEIQKAIEVIEELSMNEKEWELYQSRMYAISDYNTGIEIATQKGKKERDKGTG